MSFNLIFFNTNTHVFALKDSQLSVLKLIKCICANPSNAHYHVMNTQLWELVNFGIHISFTDAMQSLHIVNCN